MPGYFQDRLFTRLRRGKSNKNINTTTRINNNKDSELNIILHTININ